MTTLIKPRTVPSLLWQTLHLAGRHFLPLFAIGGIPWAVFALIPILLGQEQSFAELKRAQVPLSVELLYPFAWAGLYGAMVFLGVLGIGVLLMQGGPWAEALGSGLTNLLCMVGVTGVYWEERGRVEGV